jgi:hypothetical protein
MMTRYLYILLLAAAVPLRAPAAPEITGPIVFALYTVQDATLKMTAQLYPDLTSEGDKVTLAVERGGEWKTVGSSAVTSPAVTAHFRVESWDASRDARYRVTAGGQDFEGVIRRDPADKQTIVAATFTGNSNAPGGGNLPRTDIIDALTKIDPDVLLFTGDQVYPHDDHTTWWITFGEQFRDIIRDRPTVTIPDDHDVGHYNLFGAGGRPTRNVEAGGYVKPPSYVNMVQQQQTWHLPDPYDPTPVEQGITVYYTSLNVGGIDFAILEDRKWKSGCADIVPKDMGPRADQITVPDYDPKALDAPGKELLGERQLRFLDAWAQDWDGVDMKAVVSQTVFAMTTTHHHWEKKFYYADLDSNGWPQTGRNKGVEALRRAFAFHINGDQHLGTIGQYGLDEFRDSGWWFCVPSIANTYPRWWEPKQERVGPAPGATDEYTGDYFEGFGNRMTIYAHTNPRPGGREPRELLDRNPGYGIVRFDRKARTITMECWPRMVDPATSPTAQYKGWPRTISQLDNYPRKPAGHLPAVRSQGGELPVVQVVDEAASETLYTLRIPADGFEPPVFSDGPHTLRVTLGGKTSVQAGIRPRKASPAPE